MSDLGTILEQAARDLAMPAAELRERERRLGVDGRRERLMRSDAPIRPSERRMLIEDLGIEDRPALVAARAWHTAAIAREAPGPNVLVLCGPEGSGRTFAASWLLGREGGLYRDVERFLYLVARASTKRARMRERADARAMRKARVLVLAGVGTERYDEATREAFSVLLHARQARRSSLTVLVTELSPSGFRDHAASYYDARTNERLVVDGHVVNVTRGGDGT